MLSREDAERLARASARFPEGLEALPPADRERASDSIGRDVVAAAFAEARRAPDGAPGEPARRTLRLLVPLFLAEATSEIRRELARRESPGEGERAALLASAAYESDAVLRSRAARALEADAERRRDAEAEIRAACDAAGRSAGAAGALDLLDATASRRPDAFLSPIEAVAIAPLDDAVLRAASERRRRSPWGEAGGPRADEVPFLERLGDRAEAYSPREIRGAVSGIAEAIGGEIDVTLATEPVATARAELPAEGRGRLSLSSHGGPGPLKDALRALGWSLRHDLHRRGALHPGTDPAFGFAAGELLARTAVRHRGLGRWVPDLADDVRADVAFEAALTPRVAWARSFGDSPWEREAIARLARATGRPAAPWLLGPLRRAPSDRSAPLRGVVFAVLLEERLLVRFGYRWWEGRGARSLLREIWGSEEIETPESVATALGLGTMDASPIPDAYRP